MSENSDSRPTALVSVPADEISQPNPDAISSFTFANFPGTERFLEICKDREDVTSQNFAFMMKAIRKYRARQLEEQTDKTPYRKREIELEWQEKVERFKAYFTTALWSDIIHYSESDIPHDAGRQDKVELKSPEKLLKASEGRNLEDVARHSSTIDFDMGSTKFVYAGLKGLPTRSHIGGYAYGINPQEEGVAVPIDIADMFAVAPFTDNKELYARIQVSIIETYTKNVLSIQDFQQFFALYAALFFERPEQAIITLHSLYSKALIDSNLWNELTDDKLFEERQKRVLDDYYIFYPGSDDFNKHVKEARAENLLFRQLALFYKKYNIFPPIGPEFQYRDTVEATAYHKLLP